MSRADHLVRYRGAVELVRVWEEAQSRLRRAFAEVVAVEEMLTRHFARDPTSEHVTRSCDVRVRTDHRFDFANPDYALTDVRHQVWDRLIDQLGVRQFLSIRAAEDLDRQLRDRQMPEITLETMRDLAQSYRSQIASLHEDAVREVFDLLRPRSSWGAKHKTNEKNRWQLGKKVVLTGWVERTFSKRYVLTREQQATALENVLRALDGKGMVQASYHPDLYHAVELADEEGRGETEHFRFRCFRNGNLHLEFKRMDLVAQLNKIAGGRNLRGKDANA